MTARRQERHTSGLANRQDDGKCKLAARSK
jgi:hypothetical protein